MWSRNNFYFGDNISVGVRDLSRAVAWYQEKLGLRLTPLKSEDFDAFLSFSKNDETGIALVSIPAGQAAANVEGHPIVFTKRIEACRQEIASRGVTVGPIQQDSGGNSFFQFHDCDDNKIEVCIEPR
jgi:catechol 2,3-dioxygenase-like lactoylglutathione lyase family enzyme